MSRQTLFGLLLPVAALAALAVANLFVGPVDIDAAIVADALSGQLPADSPAHFIVIESRLPEMLAAMLSGAALAVGGMVMQTVFSNPLADPSILGVSSGASLGSAVAMLFLGGSLTAGSLHLTGYLLTIAASFAGAMAVIALLAAFSAMIADKVMLLVAGVMISFVASSVISLLNFFSTEQGVHSYIIWGMGDFGGVTLDRLLPYALLIVAALVAVALMAKPLNALLLGETYAANLGIGVKASRTALLLATGWLTAVVTAMCGPISFIGMAVPHAARMAMRCADHRRLLPATLLWGANIALLCNLLAHLPGSHGTLPINALTPLMGVPIVMYILCKRKS